MPNAAQNGRRALPVFCLFRRHRFGDFIFSCNGFRRVRWCDISKCGEEFFYCLRYICIGGEPTQAASWVSSVAKETSLAHIELDISIRCCYIGDEALQLTTRTSPKKLPPEIWGTFLSRVFLKTRQRKVPPEFPQRGFSKLSIQRAFPLESFPYRAFPKEFWQWKKSWVCPALPRRVVFVIYSF